MVSFLLSIIAGIIGNFLTPFLTPFARKIFAKRRLDIPQQNEEPAPLGESEPAEEGREHIRAINRAKLESVVSMLILYGATFYILYQAVALPLNFKLFGTDQFSLLQTRLGLDVSLHRDIVPLFSFGLAVLFYYPAFITAQRIAYYVAAAWDKLEKVTSIQLIGLTVVAFSVPATLLSGHWIYLLYTQYSYGQALMIPVSVGIFGLFAFVSESAREKR
ncbi:hypothetical protein [Thalassolituus sp.]|uniref:hypothetical protein n=1 Tax=Thalassolituus sp. TaxID=2030822 RepID=UPI002605C335|nr:hypothetical protein [Thalassolituus sp.]